MSVVVLSLHGLTCRFGGLIAVNDVTLEVPARSIHGLIGPNGAGKTTTFNLISGALKPTDGRVMFEGADITGMPMHALARRGLVRTFQHAQLFPTFTVFKNVLMGLYVHAHAGVLNGMLNLPGVRRRNAALEDKAREIIRFVGLAGREDEIAGALSHGYKRILQVAIGLAPEPRLIMLDEPVAGMNHGDVDRMMELVLSLRDAQGITVVLVEHNMKAVMNVCDRISVLQFGKLIAEGSPAEIAANQAVVDAYLGVFDDDAA